MTLGICDARDRSSGHRSAFWRVPRGLGALSGTSQRSVLHRPAVMIVCLRASVRHGSAVDASVPCFRSGLHLEVLQDLAFQTIGAAGLVMACLLLFRIGLT